MDDDTANLVRQLCTRAGMIMGDASAVAMLVGGKTPSELRSIVRELEIATGRIGPILAAAKGVAQLRLLCAN